MTVTSMQTLQHVVQFVLPLAHSAQSKWRSTEAHEHVQSKNQLSRRIAMIRATVQQFEQCALNDGKYAQELASAMGRPVRYAEGEVRGYCTRARALCDLAEQGALDSIIVDDLRRVDREPLGTVLVIASWNYPYLVAVNGIIAALLAGNTVLLKHAPETHVCAERIVQSFVDAQFPLGVIQHIQLSHEDTAALVSHVDGVTFTGSAAGGLAMQKAIAAAASLERYIPLTLELGGCDAAYVRHDLNEKQLFTAVNEIVDGAVFNCGQSCCGIQRVFVHSSLYELFKSFASQILESHVIGDPLLKETTLGPLIRPSNAVAVRKAIASDLAQGATLLLPEKIMAGEAFVAPNVLLNTKSHMNIRREEVFGPVFALVPVSSDDEAIELINETKYGLTASIWTHDATSISGLIHALQVGTVLVNRCDYLDPHLAWSGTKSSGRGVSLSSLGLQSMTRTKSVLIQSIE